MRPIDRIVVHASGDPAGRDVTVKDLDRRFRARGFFSIGYHHVVGLDGTIHPGRPEERPGVQAFPHNRTAIGVCFVGGLDATGTTSTDTRTGPQKDSLRALLAGLRARFPEARIVGRYHGGLPGYGPAFNPEEEFHDL